MDDMYANVSEIYENTPEIEIKYDPIDYANETRKRAEAVASAQLDKSNRDAWNTILDYWDLSPIESNLNLVRQFCNGEITVERFQEMLKTPGEAESLDWKGTRDRILQEIAEIYADSVVVDGRSRPTQLDVAAVIQRFRYETKPALRAKLAELKFRKGKSASEARQLLDQHRAAERASNPFHPYETMPSNITRATIQAATVPQIKYFNQRYGQAQVKARLNQQ
jgi:hypothetical protein